MTNKRETYLEETERWRQLRKTDPKQWGKEYEKTFTKEMQDAIFKLLKMTRGIGFSFCIDDGEYFHDILIKWYGKWRYNRQEEK